MNGTNIGLNDLEDLAWSKYADGLMPVIIQDAKTKRVLMLGYTNQATLPETIDTGLVVMQSRKRGRWMKGETSGNFLNVAEGAGAIRTDCDSDSILILANPVGPTCHLGTVSCFGENDPPSISDLWFFAELENIIRQRCKEMPQDSYTTKLFAKGIKRIAQKVGEEGVELALAAVAGDRKEVISEAADLFFHVLVLLRSKDIDVVEVMRELETRNSKRPEPAAAGGSVPLNELKPK